MKNFFRETWTPGTQLLTGFLVLVAIIWSTAWSAQDKALNLWPLIFCVGFYLLFWIIALLKRNSP